MKRKEFRLELNGEPPNNFFKRAIAKEFKDIDSLTLSHNFLTSFPDFFDKFNPNLQKLDIGNNLLTELPPTLFSLTSLSNFTISNNQFEIPLEIITEISTSLRHLTYFSCASNQLVNLPTNFTSLQYLTDLNLSHNKFQKFPKEICELKSLQKLNLSFNHFHKISKQIIQLNKLREVDFSNCAIVDFTPLIHIHSLVFVNLNQNEISSLPHLIESEDLSSLVTIRLNYNNFNDLPEKLTKLKSIKNIYLRGNPLKNISNKDLRKTKLHYSLKSIHFRVKKPTKFPFPSKIFKPSDDLGALYLGDYNVTINKHLLEHLKITDILIITNIQPPYPQSFNYEVIPILDKPHSNLFDHFEETFQFIHSNRLMKRNVLVHCYAGISRGPSIVIAYLMKLNSMTFGEAFDYVYKRRKIIWPNSGFQKQLFKYESEVCSPSKIQRTNKHCLFASRII